MESVVGVCFGHGFVVFVFGGLLVALILSSFCHSRFSVTVAMGFCPVADVSVSSINNGFSIGAPTRLPPAFFH